MALRGELAVAMLPRTSAFTRTVAGRTSAAQVVAANLDTVLVVDALVGETRLRRVERYLAVAWGSGAMPVVVLTKADLCDDVAAAVAEVAEDALGVEVLPGQLGDREGSRPSARCSGRAGRARWSARRASASPASPTRWPGGRWPRPARSGRATAAAGTPRRPASCTSSRAAGCSSTPPGMRELGLYDDAEGVDTAYADVASLAAECRFRDCGHRSEPGCAVAAALDDGRLDPARYIAWRKLQAEAHRQLLRVDARARAAEKARLRSSPGHPGAAQPAPLTRAALGSFASVRVVVIGSGAREHALCVALSSDPAVSALACAPGNAGTRAVAEPLAVDVADPDAIAALAVAWRADLVVVGPEVPLVAGAADAVRDAGIACFGPSAEAAQLEGSKSFAKHVMTAAGVPTARAWPVGGPAELETALDEVALLGPGAPYVVKDDGLAAGKGVVVTPDRAAARRPRARGAGRGRRGPHRGVPRRPRGVAVRAVTDGTTVLPLLPAQDLKRRDDGDAGPNTGGMGAYAPLPWAPPGLVDEVLATVLQPTVDEMARRGEPFAGLLYAGLALTSRGVRVVEFNARFGDPETQVVLPLLETPLAGLLHAAATGTLAELPPLRWREGAAVTVVVAAARLSGGAAHRATRSPAPTARASCTRAPR